MLFYNVIVAYIIKIALSVILTLNLLFCMRNSGVLKQRARLQKAHCEQYSFALKKKK